uniref:Otopetrin-2 n=1 Tax=Macrostomum lignano TaxID=282301 RepID=A0A1I8HG81_9PLAT
TLAGISNTSPETQSSTEFQHLILAKADASSSRTPTLMLGGKAPRQHCSQQHQLLSPRRHPQQVGRHGTPLVGILKPTGAANIDLQTGYMQEAFKASLANILSGIYCILLCCLGLLIPAKVVYSKQSAIEFSFEAFYIYLFVTAIGFLACVYALLLREGADTAAATSSRLDRRWTARRNPGVRLLRRSAAKGGLYLRLGAIVFGIASMIRDGIALAASLQHGSQLTNCSHPIVPIRGALSILFTFVQLNFLFFMNAKMCINKYQVVARFFLAHLVATNTCVWLRTVLLDSSLRTSAQSSLLDRNHSIATIDRHLSTETPPAYDRNSSCATDTDSFIRDMIWKSDPYLFPRSSAPSGKMSANSGHRAVDKSSAKISKDDDENVDDDDEAVAAAAAAASESAAMDSQQSPHRLLSTSPAATYRRQRRNTCDGSHRGLCLGLASLVCAAVALLTSAA